MPHTTTTTELQRHFKRVIARVKRLKEPVTVLSKNKPSIVLVDYTKFNQTFGVKKVGKPFFGIWKHSKITNKEIDEAVKDWDRKVDQLSAKV